MKRLPELGFIFYFFVFFILSACATSPPLPKLMAYSGEPLPESETALLRLPYWGRGSLDNNNAKGYLLINQHEYRFRWSQYYVEHTRGFVPTYSNPNDSETILFEGHDLLLRPGEQTIAYHVEKVSHCTWGPFDGVFNIFMEAKDRYIFNFSCRRFLGWPTGLKIIVKDLDTGEPVKEIEHDQPPYPHLFGR